MENDRSEHRAQNRKLNERNVKELESIKQEYQVLLENQERSANRRIEDLRSLLDERSKERDTVLKEHS